MSSPTTASRLDGDSRRVVIIVLWLVATLAVVAFVVGIPGLVMVAEWAGLVGPLRFGVPIVLDVGIAVMALAAVVRRARLESTRFTVGALGVLTGLSVAAQVAHVIVPAAGAVTAQDIVGAGVASLAPLMVFAATHVLLDLAIAPPVKRKTRRAGGGASRSGQATGRTRATHAAPVREPGARPSGPVPAADPAVQMDPDGGPTGPVGEPATVDDELTALVHARRAERATDADIAAELKNRGATNGQIAELLDVSVSTVKRLRAQAEERKEEVPA